MPGGTGRAGDRRLLRIYRSLDAENQRTLAAFAEFLAARQGTGEVGSVQAPRPEPRPPDESVVAAIKRLSRTYFMLARNGALLSDVSTLMAAHVLRGRAAPDVIDELEVLFARGYAEYRERASPER